jgi:hypothetical protein
MRDTWGFRAIRRVGHSDLSLNPTGDSRVCYIAQTNHLKATRSAGGTTYLEAWIRRPIGTVEVSAGPEKTIATMALTDPRIKIEVTARTKSAPSVAAYHSFDIQKKLRKPFDALSILCETKVQSNPYQVQVDVSASQRIRECNCFGRVSVGVLSPRVVCFADHEFLQAEMQLNLKNPKMAVSFGDRAAFFCCSMSWLKPVKIGGFASHDGYSVAATATARKTLKLRANFNGGGYSLSGLYDRTPLSQKLTVGGRAPYDMVDIAWKYEAPDLFTISVGVGTAIRVTLAGLLKLGGESLADMIRYSIDAWFMGED